MVFFFDLLLANQMKRDRFKVILSLAILAMCLFGISAKALNKTSLVYYVATNGNDNYPGTNNQPLKTIQQAVNKITHNGGIIYLRSGTYQFDEATWIPVEHSGTVNSHLVIRPYQNELVILDGNFKADSCISVGGEYVDVIGFECRHAKNGIVGWGATHLQVFNNTIHDVNATGIGIYAPKIFGTKDILVNHNTVYHTNLNNQSRRRDGSWGAGIAITRTELATVTNNRVYENYGEGITSTLSHNVVAANNVFYDNYSVEMYMDNTTNTVFENNLIYNTGNQNYFRLINDRFSPATGIQMANEIYEAANPLNNNIIRNNIVINGLVGLTYGNYGSGGGIKNTQILNNTFYQNSGRLLSIAIANHENTVFINNIFYQTPSSPISSLPPNLTGLNFQHNLWYGDHTSADASLNFSDPKFINPGSFFAKDYKLQKGSPAINAGVSLREVSKDYFGNRRPINGGYDIGAHEFGGTK